jgi:hypothetical protein
VGGGGGGGAKVDEDMKLGLGRSSSCVSSIVTGRNPPERGLFEMFICHPCHEAVAEMIWTVYDGLFCFRCSCEQSAFSATGDVRCDSRVTV